MVHDNTKSTLNVPAVLTASERALWTSIWHSKPCPICGKGILKIGTKNQVLQYKGREYASVLKGAFCDHCDDGFPKHDPQEQEAWIKFRDSCGKVNDIIGRRFLTCPGGTKLSVLAKSVKSNSFSDGGASSFSSLFFEVGFSLLTLFPIIFSNL